ncbi:MAG: hypothetical protein CUN55_21595, partial [Phototrophicales bacterium]
AAAQANYTIRCFNWLAKWMKEAKITPSTFDRYLCKVCYHGLDLQKKRGVLSVDEQKSFRDYESHRHLISSQKRAYDIMMARLNDCNAIVVFDYTTIHE